MTKKTDIPITKIQLTDLIEDEKNPRKKLALGDYEYQKIEASLNIFGVVDPIIVRSSDLLVIGGHQRITVLREQGVKDLNLIRLGGISWVFPDTDLKEPTDPEVKALNIALNKIAGEWDFTLLAEVLETLQAGEFDVTLTGFSTNEIMGMIGDTPDIDTFLADSPKGEPKKKTAKCPECGTEFEI